MGAEMESVSEDDDEEPLSPPPDLKDDPFRG
jgi:hypothetical protein